MLNNYDDLKIVSNINYTIHFQTTKYIKAILSICKNVCQTSVRTYLDEYLDNYFFIFYLI